jgi:hypothetical protein
MTMPQFSHALETGQRLRTLTLGSENEKVE